MPKKFKIITLSVLLVVAGFVAAFVWDNGDTGELLSAALANCSDNNNRTDNIVCIRDYLEKDVSKTGIKPYIQAVEESYSAGEFASDTQCHDVLHAVGNVEGQNTQDLNTSLSGCSSVCTYGCYHGIVEGYVASGRDILEQVDTACDLGNSTAISACFHGLGHGFSELSGYDLQKSLTSCDTIPTEGGVVSCTGGVFMELYEQGTFLKDVVELPADIPAFCSGLWEPHREFCLNQAGHLEYGRSQDVERSISACNRVPAVHTDNCFTSLGRNSFYVFAGDPEKVLQFCQKMPMEQVPNCMGGVVQSSVAADPSLEKREDMCNVIKKENIKPNLCDF